MEKHYCILLTFILCITTTVTAYAANDARHALVIGNSQYQHAAPLQNPQNDSADIAAALKELDFKTQLLQDATKQQIEDAAAKFLKLLSQKGGVGLLYYAGHGVQLEGDNYLVPVETDTQSDQSIQDQSYNIARLLDGLHQIQTDTNIIILDACRDNPFKNRTNDIDRSGGSGESRSLRKKDIPRIKTGLSKLDAPPNTLIAFSTAPGRIALDGTGKNSPYTSKLIKALNRKGLTIEQVFRQVRSDVVKQTKGKQVPWESSSLINSFYFKPRTSLPMGF